MHSFSGKLFSGLYEVPLFETFPETITKLLLWMIQQCGVGNNKSHPVVFSGLRRGHHFSTKFFQ
jgi:hypothetical protein